MIRFFKKLHLYYFLFWLGVAFIILYPVIYLFSRKPVNFNGMNLMRLTFSFVNSAFSGIFFRFNYEQPVDWSKNYIIVANHTSNLDITAMILMIKRNLVFMGKDELMDNLVTGIYFRTIDIPLNRDSKMSAFRAFKKAGEYVQGGTNVVIFPEGMISNHYPPVLQPFKNGPFKLAIEQGAEILPVTICNAWKLIWDDGNKYGSKPGICDIYIHPPVNTQGMVQDDAENLRDTVFNLIDGKLKEYEANLN